jgi:exopolysaccharide biosynthesis polyprenyl glycosylphosphotransferase
MKNNASLIYNLFLIVGDSLALVAAFAGAYILRVTLSDLPFIQIPALTYLTLFLVLLPFWVIIFALLGLYNSSIYEKRFSELGRLLVGSFIGLLFVIAAEYVTDRAIFPARIVPVYGFGLAFIFLVIFRNLARFIRILLFGYNVGLTNVLIIGDTKISMELVDTLLDSRQSGYRILGVIGNKKLTSDRYPDVTVFENFGQAVAALGNAVHTIMQTELYADEEKNREILEYAQTHHIAYRFVPGNTELFVGNIEVELFRSSLPVIAVHQTPLLAWGRVTKRLFDVAVAGLMLLLLSPLLILIAILNKLTDRGPVFFKQTRLTRFNNEFRVYKFRTHITKYNGLSPEEAFAKMGRPELIKAYRENGDQLPNDPRVSRVGRFLRRLSLDELPQLFNVLRGDLSLVGPRALVPEELKLYAKRHTILSVKSGLTGLAQVSGRRDINFEERRKLDMFYVQNWSFWLDIVILLKTLRVVLGGKGAK